jgi:hypothetical protein
MGGYYGPGPTPGPVPSSPPRSGGPNGPRGFGLAAMAVLIAVTAVSFAVSRSGKSSASSFADPTNATSRVVVNGTTDSTKAPVFPKGGTTRVTAVPRATTPVPPTTRPRITTPAPPKVTMSTYGVRNVLYKFFDGFLYHRLSDIRGAVCPRYRYLYNGTYLLNPKGWEIYSWRSSSYTLLPAQNYVDIYVSTKLRNPENGATGKTWNHTWVIQKDHANYYVCGYRV